MTLAAGTKLGPYEVLAPLGAGGMGEVYKARDTRLGREVAVKVLPGDLLESEERRTRFEREARALAALNHPNIAAIYSFEEIPGAPGASSRHLLVMELVEGESLDVRISRGPLPLEESLSVARQIAEALEAAHEKGIVHRDLKPANVKVTEEGKVKLLDFGLAKALEGERGSSKGNSGGGVTQSPTLTARGTAAGVILGTAAYMSPEQARGRAVDKRTDIWAFGCMFYETLTGRRAFDGETVSDTLAAVLRQDVDLGALSPETPASVRRLLARCLERDAKRRLRDIGEARIALDPEAAAERTGPETTIPISSWRRGLPWTLAVVLAAVSGATFWTARRGTTKPAAPIRVTVELTDDALVRVGSRSIGTNVVLSPAGDLLVFVPAREGSPVYARRLDELAASPLPGTEGGSGPFFSPDGASIAFFADGKLKKVSLSGGAATTLADAENPRGGAWLEDGTIVFAPRVESPLLRVPANGGSAVPITALDAEQRTHRWPDGLPGGRGLLYTSHTKTGSYNDASLVVQGPGGQPRRVLLRGGYQGRYLPSGHIVYLHDQTLFAVPFDCDRLELAGPAVPVIPGVVGVTANGTAQFSASRNGLLIYAPVLTSPRVLSWLDRSGRLVPLRSQPAGYRDLRLSPEADRAALTIEQQGGSGIWILDLRRETLSRLTFQPGNHSRPVWTPDGRRIAYTSWRDDVSATNLYWQRADGSGQPERLTTSPNRQFQGSWHPTGKFFAFTEARPGSLLDLMILPVEGDEKSGFRPGTPEPFLSTPFQEQDPAFSPDGHWLAYTSNESGTFEVYVRPFPGPGGKWQISAESGGDPRWSPTRPELLYRSGDRLMVVPYRAEGGSFQPGTPRPWAELPPATEDIDWHPSSDRVALVHPERDTRGGPPTRILFLNFFDELRRLATVRAR
jgi:serine/threonine-protein kinase